jgi:hypothetical protein
MQKDRMQLFNPVTKKWVKLNTKIGGIVGHKHDNKPYKNVMTPQERDNDFKYQFEKKITEVLQKKVFTINPKYARRKIKCDCGHYAKEHYLREGSCNKCGCTWYYPNVHWIKKQQRLKAIEYLKNK